MQYGEIYYTDFFIAHSHTLLMFYANIPIKSAFHIEVTEDNIYLELFLLKTFSQSDRTLKRWYSNSQGSVLCPIWYIDNYSLSWKVSKYLDWVADQFGMVVDAPWTIFEDQNFWKRNGLFDHWSFEVKKEIGWLNNKNTESQEVLYEYQHSAVLYFMPLHLRLITWSSEHFKSRKILDHCSKPESLRLIKQKT